MATECEFIQVYNGYYQKILAYLSRIIGSNDAEDLTQEVFDKISRSLPGFKGKSKISTWIYRIATNTAIDRLRSASYKKSLDTSSLQDSTVPELWSTNRSARSHAADEIVVRKEMSECVNEFIDNLPLDYKTVLVLSDLSGLSYQEIADILQISLNNVKVRIHRAREKLKSELKEGCDFYVNEEGILACDRKQGDILPKMPK